MANPLYFPEFRAFDINGDPLAGGKVYTYDAGTSAPRITYTDSSLTTPNTNPVILDSTGYPESGGIWLSGTYKIVITDANGVQQGDTIDNFANDSGAQGPAGTFQMATAGGTVDAITATYTPPLTLSNLVTCGFVALGANATATPTFAPDGLMAHTITKRGGVALKAGDIPGALAACFLEYNSANTRWELINPATDNIPWVAAGGTANAITATYSPAIPALYDGLILSFRATAANSTTTPTFAPSGLTAHTITKNGGSALVAGDIAGNLAEYWVRYNLANTRWELLNSAVSAASTTVSGIVELATSAETQTGTDTVRAVTPAGLKAAVGFSNSFTSSDITLSSGNQSYTAVAHGLGGLPVLVFAYIRCTSADNNYSVGDILQLPLVIYNGTNTQGIMVQADATNVKILQVNSATALDKTTAALITGTALDETKWVGVIKAWR